jgi:hypothetical protein
MSASAPPAGRTGRLSSRARIVVPLLAVLCAIAVVPAAASAASMHWARAVRVEPSRNGGVNAVSCPTSRFCVAVDDSGYVVTTTDPTGSKHVWSPTARIDHASLTGISCPSTSLCVAVDDSGNVLTSTHPTGGARAWSHPAKIDSTPGPDGGPAGLSGVSCPSTRLCVAVDAAPAGHVLTSTSPTGGAGAWKLTAVGGGPLTSVSCVQSSSLCVAAGAEHVYSTNPGGGAGAWHATGGQTGGGVISAIDCPGLSQCIAVGFGDTATGLVSTTRNPRGGLAGWKTVTAQDTPPDQGEGLLDGVGCTRGFCVAVDGFDNAYTSAAPGSGTWSGPTAVRGRSAAQTTAISCTSGLCVVVDSAGVSTTGILR